MIRKQQKSLYDKQNRAESHEQRQKIARETAWKKQKDKVQAKEL